MDVILTIPGESGVYHFETFAPKRPDPFQGRWTFEERKTRHRSRLYTLPELPKREQERAAWEAIQADFPATPRAYLLRELAKGMKLAKKDADRSVFGSHLRPSERSRNYLSSDGQPFDLYISECIADFYPDSYSWSGERLGDVESEWLSALHDIVQEVHSTKAARELLIVAYLKQHGPSYEEPHRTVLPESSAPVWDEFAPAF